MTTTSPQGRPDFDPAEEEALEKLASLQGDSSAFFNLRTGEVNWRAFFDENPELNPPGYDETVAKMNARKQQVGTPKGPFSLSTAMQEVNETRRVRAERNKLGGLPPPDAQKQPQKRF